MSGRPLRFLAGVGGGWTVVRLCMLWPTIDSAPALLHAIVPFAAAETHAASSLARPIAAPIAFATVLVAPAAPAQPSAALPARVADPQRVRMALLGLIRFGDPEEDAGIVPGLPQPAPAPPAGGAAKRWSGSFWLVGRGAGGASSGLVGGQLGGSQAGVRVAYALDVRHRVAAAARVTTPLGSGQHELAVGVEWQPTRLPIRVVAEQRVALGTGLGGPTLGLVGGVGPIDVVAGFRLEGYGQAGVIGRRARDGGAEGFVDGAARFAHPVMTLGVAHVDLGAALWGAAQRGASRLDLGPSLAVVLPLAKQNVRLSLDWRERVAGDARPGSGPAVTLGADF